MKGQDKCMVWKKKTKLFLTEKKTNPSQLPWRRTFPNPMATEIAVKKKKRIGLFHFYQFFFIAPFILKHYRKRTVHSGAAEHKPLLTAVERKPYVCHYAGRDKQTHAAGSGVRSPAAVHTEAMLPGADRLLRHFVCEKCFLIYFLSN